MTQRFACIAIVAALAGAAAQPVSAEPAQLGGERYTCMGAERAANADGTIPAFGGRWSDSYPGYKGPGVYSPGPYVGEKPLFAITAANATQYAGHLTEGQKALLQRYPEGFRMPVYRSHRDFAYSEAVCAIVRGNAGKARVVNDGKGIDATAGAPAFPFPKSGLELHWNMVTVHRARSEQAVLDQAAVYGNGRKAWGQVEYSILSMTNHIDPPHSTQEPVDSYFFVRTLLPDRSAGELYVGWNPADYHNHARQTWFYSPGTRRVRQAPEFGFDTPQGAGGFRTVDDDRLFNGTPERYDWTLVGKREVYIPYNAFTQNDPALAYAALLTPSSLNPDHMRYELHRVWVLEAVLKPGYRHSYQRRRFYIDEDSWHVVWADNYDSRGELWRASLVNYFWAPEMRAFHAGISVYHDLTAGAYVVDRLVNQSRRGWQLNQGGLTPEDFTPAAARRQGH